MSPQHPARLLLLLPTTSYRADAFMASVSKLDVELTVATDEPSSFVRHRPDGLLTLPFGDLETVGRDVRRFHEDFPISAVLGVDDDTAVAGAAIAAQLCLSGNPLAAAIAARDKHRQRVSMRAAGVPVPAFSRVDVSDDPRQVAARIGFPSVLKPLHLSASRGVIRANDTDEFVSAFARVGAIVRRDAPAAVPDAHEILIEEYIPGSEFAVEGIIVDGTLHILAVFDKPDPLVGPFFEETIYVTPSRLDPSALASVERVVHDGVRALGLRVGPVHAEVRLNGDVAVMIELAARPIGGKCSRVLRFGSEPYLTLEDVLVRHALGRLGVIPPREPRAAGVMMVPIPRGGILRDVSGLDAARAIPGVEDVLITVHRGAELVPLPEGSRYLGFIFARGVSPAVVESALRESHQQLTVEYADP